MSEADRAARLAAWRAILNKRRVIQCAACGDDNYHPIRGVCIEERK